MWLGKEWCSWKIGLNFDHSTSYVESTHLVFPTSLCGSRQYNHFQSMGMSRIERNCRHSNSKRGFEWHSTRISSQITSLPSKNGSSRNFWNFLFSGFTKKGKNSVLHEGNWFSWHNTCLGCKGSRVQLPDSPQHFFFCKFPTFSWCCLPSGLHFEWLKESDWSISREILFWQKTNQPTYNTVNIYL